MKISSTNLATPSLQKSKQGKPSTVFYIMQFVKKKKINFFELIWTGENILLFITYFVFYK